MNQSVLQAGRYSESNNWIECYSAGLLKLSLPLKGLAGFCAIHSYLFLFFSFSLARLHIGVTELLDACRSKVWSCSSFHTGDQAVSEAHRLDLACKFVLI